MTDAETIAALREQVALIDAENHRRGNMVMTQQEQIFALEDENAKLLETLIAVMTAAVQ